MDKGKEDVPGQIAEWFPQTPVRGLYSVTHVYGDKLVTKSIRPLPSDVREPAKLEVNGLTKRMDDLSIEDEWEW